MNPGQKPSAKALLLMLASALLFVALAGWNQTLTPNFEDIFDDSGRFKAPLPNPNSLQEVLFFIWIPNLFSGLSLALACATWLWFSGRGLFGRAGKWLLIFPGTAALLEFFGTYLNAQAMPSHAPEFSDLFLLKAQWWLFTLLTALALSGFWISKWLFRKRGQWF